MEEILEFHHCHTCFCCFFCCCSLLVTVPARMLAQCWLSSLQLFCAESITSARLNATDVTQRNNSGGGL